jgi:hypothetical protein
MDCPGFKPGTERWQAKTNRQTYGMASRVLYQESFVHTKLVQAIKFH